MAAQPGHIHIREYEIEWGGFEKRYGLIHISRGFNQESGPLKDGLQQGADRVFIVND